MNQLTAKVVHLGAGKIAVEAVDLGQQESKLPESVTRQFDTGDAYFSACRDAGLDHIKCGRALRQAFVSGAGLFNTDIGEAVKLGIIRPDRHFA